MQENCQCRYTLLWIERCRGDRLPAEQSRGQRPCRGGRAVLQPFEPSLSDPGYQTSFFFLLFLFKFLPVLAPAREEPGLGWSEMCCVWPGTLAPGVCILLAAFSSCTNWGFTL